MESSDDKSKCFNLTWTIENFSMCLFEENICLEARIFKTEIAIECTWWQLNMTHDKSTIPGFKFALRKISGEPKNRKCHLALGYHFGEVKLSSSSSDDPDFHMFTVMKSAIFSDNKRRTTPQVPKDIFTVHCKIWYEMIKPQDRLIHTVLKKVNFNCKFDASKTYTFSRDIYFFGNENIQLITTQHKFEKNEIKISAEGQTNRNGWLSFVNCTLTSNQLDSFDKEIITPSFRTWRYIPFRSLGIYRFKLDSIVGIEMTPHQELPLTLPPEFASGPPIPSLAKHSNSINSSDEVSVSSRTLTDDFLHFYKERKLSDATLNTEGKSFPVHRSILAARSSVFHAMFEKDLMSEGRSGVVDIDDVDSETVDRMLVFLYGDKLRNVNWEEASALYYAADKYDVQPLKEKCADILMAGLTVGNACDALVLADKHSNQELRKFTVDFIRNNQEVLSSTEWDKLEESNLRLAANILREVFVKRVDKTVVY